MSERREVAPGVWVEAEKLPPEAMDGIEDAVLREVTAHLKGCRTVHLTFEGDRVWSSHPEVLEAEGYYLTREDLALSSTETLPSAGKEQEGQG